MLSDFFDYFFFGCGAPIGFPKKKFTPVSLNFRITKKFSQKSQKNHTFVFAPEFNSDSSFNFTEHSIVGNTLSGLVLINDLRLLIDFSRELFLSHSFGISSLLNEFSHTHADSLIRIKIKILFTIINNMRQKNKTCNFRSFS